MKVFRFIRNVTAVVGFALLLCAGCSEDMSAILSFAKWGCVALIPAALYITYDYLFGVEE